MKFSIKTKPNLNVLIITFVNIRITFSPNDYRKWAKNLLQQNFCFLDWDLKTILYFFPFLVGFCQIIIYKYPDQTFSFFFEKTLPKYKILKEELSRETFELIKLKDRNVNQIKKMHIYSDFFIFELKQNYGNFLIGFFADNDNQNKINSTNYKLVLTDLINFFENYNLSKNIIFNEIYYNLDELPLKVQEINKKNSSKKDFFDSALHTLKNETLKIETKNLTKRDKKVVLLPKIFQKETIFLPKLAFGLCSYTKNSTNFVSNKIYNSEIKTIIQDELDILFYNSNLQPVIPSKRKSLTKLRKKSKKLKKTLNILKDYLPIRINKLLFIRKFSGYLYPDLLVNKVYSTIVNLLLKPLKNISFFQINLPSGFIYAFQKDFYSTRFFFKQLKISNRKNGFFGSNVKYFLKKKNKNEPVWKRSILKEIFKIEKFTFEDLNDYDPNSSFLVYELDKKNKTINFEKKDIDRSINKNSTNFFIFSKKQIKNKRKISKLKYYSNIFNENLMNNNFNNFDHIGEIYKKTPTLSNILKNKKSFFQTNNFNSFQLWEPLSNHSWMLIMQFYLSLFFLRLVIDLYKDYGRELVHYLLESASSSEVDIEKVKEQYLYDDPEFRLINKINKNFQDVAGIDKILPELAEIVWFLRNTGRLSKFKNSIPKGILLTGPPGTGKTLLVQAIAGEAEVPVIVESGSLLTDPQQKGRGIEKLKEIFNRARQLAPCIVFIDEVDTIGEKRENIIPTAMGEDELIESIYENQVFDNNVTFIPQPLNLIEEQKPEKDLEYELFRGNSQQQPNNVLAQFQKKIEIKKIRLSILTQFLVEIDGFKERQGVIVIGATNRPNVLDPALIRPGRFDQILNLELPGKTKRIEILKFYSKKLKIDKKISWEYLANRTQGFSAADLAAAMNESAIQAILNQTKHTIETIERGIELVTSYSNDNATFITKKNKFADPFFVSRLAYYQSGKAILQTLLPNHQPIVILHLWPRQKNTRHTNFYKKFFTGNKTQLDLEIQLIGLYSGKAAEMLTLYGYKFIKSIKKWQSDLGIEDLLSANFLANLMVDNYFFYSNKVSTRKFSSILNNQNIQEFKEPEKLEVLVPFKTQIEDEIEIEQIAKLVRNTGYEPRGFGPWWQIQISKQISEIDSFFANWYRLYLPDPEERLLNLEWIPPEQFYHTNESLKQMSQKSDSSINDLYKIERDYIFHGLLLNAFNKAFSDLENMREFLDYFADYLTRYEVLREDQIFFILRIQRLSNKFYLQKKRADIKKIIIPKEKKEISKQKIIIKSWGNQSRRQNFRFINFETLDLKKDFPPDDSSPLNDKIDK